MSSIREARENEFFLAKEGVPFLGTILAFHGGEFVKGNTRWDRPQNTLLANTGFEVYQLHLPKKWSEFKEWATSDAMEEFLQQQSQNKGPLIVLGRSSGGYLAKWFFRAHSTFLHKAIYLSPVFQPDIKTGGAKRFFENKKRGEEAEQQEVEKLEYLNASCELLLITGCEQNQYSEIQKEHAIVLGPRDHKGLCTTASKKFARKVEEFARSF